MISRNKRKELILEILSDNDFSRSDFFLPTTDFNKQIINSLDPNFVYNDRFSILMETADIIIGPEKIKGFRIENIYGGKHLLKIKTRLHINDDMELYRKIENIKINFFDNKGNILKSNFEYPVDYKGFYLMCDYSFRDYLTPIYEYEILENFF